MWTQFWDMNSGGGRKEQWSHIYIEAPEAEAKVVFYNRFGHNPERVTCTCCGNDYVTAEHESLAQLSGFQRGCRALETPRDPETGLYRNDDPVIVRGWYLEDGDEVPEGYELSRWGGLGSKAYLALDEYLARPDVLTIPASEIKDEERKGSVPEQGYVWVG